jgi:hypothetical protein
MALPQELRFDLHLAARAFSRALFNAGSSIAAKMAMMAMTTNNSINVNPLFNRLKNRAIAHSFRAH